MASETAYAPLAQEEEQEPKMVEYEPSEKPQQAPAVDQTAVAVADAQQVAQPVFWVPVSLARRNNRWRGSCIQCCGSSGTDCKACCFATWFPCLAFGHNMRKGLMLGFVAQCLLYFFYVYFFSHLANVGAAVQCGVPPSGFQMAPHHHGHGPHGYHGPHHMHGMHGMMDPMGPEDGEVDRWMMNMHHHHRPHRRSLADGTAADELPATTALPSVAADEVPAVNVAADELPAQPAAPGFAVPLFPANPEALVGQLTKFFEEVNAQANEDFARLAAQTAPIAQMISSEAAAARAPDFAGYAPEVMVRQSSGEPQVSSEVVILPQPSEDHSSDEFPQSEARFAIYIDSQSAPEDYDSSSTDATTDDIFLTSSSDSSDSDSSSSSSSSSSSDLVAAAERAAFEKWDSCMCKWRMVDMASKPLLLVFLVYAGFRRTQLRRRLGIPGSVCEDQLMWLCCSACALCQETRTVAHHFGGLGCPCRGPGAACANPAAAAYACQAPVAPEMVAFVAAPAQVPASEAV